MMCLLILRSDRGTRSDAANNDLKGIMDEDI